MNNQPSLPADSIESSQIRIWTRFPSDKPEMWVIVGNERKSATVLNESFGGIGVTIEMEDSVNVQVGDQLIVLHCDCPTPAQVKWIEQNQEGKKVRLGIHWSPRLASRSPEHKLALPE